MNVLFRVDSSRNIGSGHLMRCLALAVELRQCGCNVEFVSRQLDGNLIRVAQTDRFLVHSLSAPQVFDNIPNDSIYGNWLGVDWKVDANDTVEIINNIGFTVDWVIVDHYALDNLWTEQIRPYVKKVLVIDDLANRKLDCDILINPNLGMENRYDRYVSAQCRKLLGPKYALLRSEFASFHRQMGHRDGTVRRGLIFFGGSDTLNLTAQTLEAFLELDLSSISIDVVVGYSNPNKEIIRRYCQEFSNVHYHCQIDYIAMLMLKADLAIGAGGSASWERCCLGLPTILINFAENQKEISNKLAEHGAAINMGTADEFTKDRFQQILVNTLVSPQYLKAMSRKAYELVDGCGIIRAVEAMGKQ